MNYVKYLISIVIISTLGVVSATSLNNFATIEDTSSVNPPTFWVQSDGTLATNQDSGSFTETLSSSSNTVLSYNVGSDLLFEYNIDAVVSLSNSGGANLNTSINDVNVSIQDSNVDCIENSSSYDSFICTSAFSTSQDITSTDTINFEVNVSQDIDINENSNLDFQVAN